MAAPQPPALVYNPILRHILGANAGALDEERLADTSTGIRDSIIWRKLFKFQRDGVLGALDKLDRLGGCIIADSVGLGKTFEALAIVKYYELRNRRVLVLCPKRLRDNWTLYKSNDQRNFPAADRLNYDVLNHTDLSRDGLRVERAGVTTATAATDAPSVLDERDIPLPDLLTELQDKTHLTRRSLWRILASSGRFDDFPRNPQQFLSIAAEAVNRAKRLAIVDGIKYQRIGADAYYAQELFETSELIGYLKRMVEASKAAFEDVVVQSEVEARFAEQLEKNQAVKVYAKLPGWFQIATPLGPYNPDWAVLIEHDGAERLFFVVETKGGLFADDLREKENAKIHCGKAHFAALATGDHPARFVIANQLSDLFSLGS